ncbi:MAG: amino acid permease [Candidatus Kapabacteria bacterium]|nr:amino acid permease [Candidatus Kapabacteria bacterium]
MTTPSTPSNGTAVLLPRLGLVTTTAMVVGGMIGSGVFRNPSAMAGFLHSPALLIGVWVVAGIVTLFGALTNAEVAGLIPITGGQYQYFRAMYGEFMAFLYGWALFVVIQSGSIASITFVFSEYLNTLVPLWNLDDATVQSFAVSLPFGTIYPLQSIGIKLVTVAAVGLLTLINAYGVREGGRVQVVFTVAKVAAIVALVALAIVGPAGSVSNLTQPSTLGVPAGSALMLALAMAMNKALWSYDGWNNLTYVSGEVRDPQRTVPRSLVLGTLICIGVYVAINIAYLLILPIDALASSTAVARDAAYMMMGPLGATFVSLAVMVSTIGTSNGTILASSRVYYAMAKERMFFRVAERINERHHTPTVSLAMQFIWTSVLVFSGTFDMLTDMLIFVSWGFYALGAAGMFILRRKMPDAPRPYRTWGYPIVPIVFILFAMVFLGYTVVSDFTNYYAGTVPVVNSVWGLILLATGIPFYVYFSKKKSERDVEVG